MAQRNLKAIPTISLFSGAGGLDLGFSRAGFDVRVAVEVDEAACATLERNWPDLRGRILRRPLEDLPTRELLKVAELKAGLVGAVIGGPPCQSFCVAGNRLGFSDPRGRQVFEFLRVVREARPSIFCMENVPGLLSAVGPAFLERIESSVNDGLPPSRRYEVRADILNAVEYGVPQVRKRLFVVGWNTPAEFVFPRPTHHSDASNRSRKKPAVTVGDALLGLPTPSPPSSIALRVARTIPERNLRWYGKL